MTFDPPWLALACGALAFEPRSLSALIGFGRRARLCFGPGGGLAPKPTFATSVAAVTLSFGFAAAAAVTCGGGHVVAPERWALGLPLLMLSALDARAYWLPFTISLPLIVLGLIASALDDNLPQALIGVALWSGGPWLIGAAFHRLRGRPGLGGGDIALLGVIGTWCGPDAGAITVAGASVAAILAIICVRTFGLMRGEGSPRIPLGPFLCIGFWIALLTTPVGA